MDTFIGTTDIETWIHDFGEDTIFRLWVYKKIFTPYEQENKFSDESIYEDSTAKLVHLVGCIEMPNSEESILKFKDLDDDYRPTGTYYYYKFSQILLEEVDIDQKNFEFIIDTD